MDKAANSEGQGGLGWGRKGRAAEKPQAQNACFCRGHDKLSLSSILRADKQCDSVCFTKTSEDGDNLCQGTDLLILCSVLHQESDSQRPATGSYCSPGGPGAPYKLVSSKNKAQSEGRHSKELEIRAADKSRN